MICGLIVQCHAVNDVSVTSNIERPTSNIEQEALYFLACRNGGDGLHCAVYEREPIMPSYAFTGTIKKILPVMTFPSGFTKREIVVTPEGDKFPQDIAVGFTKDKIAMLDAFQEADRVTVNFNLQGREYNGKYFTSCDGWKIQKLDGNAMPDFGPEDIGIEDIGGLP